MLSDIFELGRLIEVMNVEMSLFIVDVFLKITLDILRHRISSSFYKKVASRGHQYCDITSINEPVSCIIFKQISFHKKLSYSRMKHLS